MSIMTSQILQFVDFTKTQKSKYLESETLLFLQVKKFINYTSRANFFLVEVTFDDTVKPTISTLSYTPIT